MTATPVDTAQALRIADQIDNDWGHQGAANTIRALVAENESLRSRVGEAQPVAWRWRHRDQVREQIETFGPDENLFYLWHWSEKKIPGDHLESEPLYLHPPTQPAQEAQAVKRHIATDDAVIEAAYQRLDLSSVPHAFRPSIAFEAGWKAAIATPPAQPAPSEPTVVKQSLTTEATAPAWANEPSADRLREIARSTAFSASDPLSPFACVLAGWRAAVAAGLPRATAPEAADVGGRTQAARDVLAERERQISVEGWSPEHDDDAHDAGALAGAASAYTLAAADELCPHSQGDGGFAVEPPAMFPFEREWWKPGTPRRMLVKAGALILAEIERLDRAAAKEPTNG